MGVVIRYPYTPKELALNEKNKELLEATMKDERIISVINSHPRIDLKERTTT
jgi:hypothetical protein